VTSCKQYQENKKPFPVAQTRPGFTPDLMKSDKNPIHWKKGHLVCSST